MRASMALNGRTQCTDKSSKAELAWHARKRSVQTGLVTILVKAIISPRRKEPVLGVPGHDKRAVEFLEEWVSENMVKPVAGAPEGDNSEARLRAEECVIAAKEEGIAKEDIEEEVGDLVDYMSAAIEKAVNADVDRAVMKDRS